LRAAVLTAFRRPLEFRDDLPSPSPGPEDAVAPRVARQALVI
jgi:hypothetical protein